MRGIYLMITLCLFAAFAAFLFHSASKGEEIFFGSKISPEQKKQMNAGEPTAVASKFSGDVSSASIVSRDFRANLKPRGVLPQDSAEVSKRLREMQRTDDDGLEVVTMPDGHKSIYLKGRFQHVTRLVVAEDGRLIPSCGGKPHGEEVLGE